MPECVAASWSETSPESMIIPVLEASIASVIDASEAASSTPRAAFEATFHFRVETSPSESTDRA